MYSLLYVCKHMGTTVFVSWVNMNYSSSNKWSKVSSIHISAECKYAILLLHIFLIQIWSCLWDSQTFRKKWRTLIFNPSLLRLSDRDLLIKCQIHPLFVPVWSYFGNVSSWWAFYTQHKHVGQKYYTVNYSVDSEESFNQSRWLLWQPWWNIELSKNS